MSKSGCLAYVSAFMDFEPVRATVLLPAAWEAAHEGLVALVFKKVGVEVALGDEFLATLFALEGAGAGLGEEGRALRGSGCEC